MSNGAEDEVVKAIVEHSGWFTTVFAALGLWLIKRLISAQFDEFLYQQKVTQRELRKLGKDMAAVKAVVGERYGIVWPVEEYDGAGDATWPGDSR